MMRLLLFFLVLVPVTSVSQVRKVIASDIESPAGYVYISGETNINCFECRYSNDQENNVYDDFKLTYNKNSDKTIEADIPVSEFKCSNEVMYNDFMKLLDGYEYPFLRLELDSSQINNILPGLSNIDLNVSITIANVIKVKTISCWINRTGNNNINITGTTMINILDFQLEPPVRFLGLVRVKDEVKINFSFNFKVI